MSALGHKRTFCFVRVMSAFTPESGHSAMQTNVCLGPKADMTHACVLSSYLQDIHQHDAAFVIANVGSNWAPRPALRRIRTDHKNPDIKL